MSTNNWMTVMDKMAAGLQQEAIASLREIKKCFDQEGRSFDEEYKKYFFHVSNNSLVAAYSNFEIELLVHVHHTERYGCKQMVLNSNNTSMLHIGCSDTNSSQSAVDGNSIHAAEKCSESSVVLKTESDATSTNSSIICILDSSDDEENSREPVVSTEQKVDPGAEAALANGVIMESGHGAMAFLNQSQNSKRNGETASNNRDDDQAQVKKEASKPNKKKTNDDEDISLVLVQVGRPIPMESNDAPMNAHSNGKTHTNVTSHNGNCTAAVERADTKARGKSNDTNSRPVDSVSSENLLSSQMAMQMNGKTATRKQMYSKVVKRHKCRFCEYSSNKNGHVEEHERIHTGEKPHRCRRCNKGFTQMQHLKHHAKVHAKEFAFHCLGCFEGFTQKTEYDAHVNVCKSPRYECHICKKNSFLKKWDLKVHMRKHSGEKPFRCEICLKRFSLRSSLKVHLNNIHNRIRH